MKIYYLGSVLALCLGLCGCATSHKPDAPANGVQTGAGAYVKLISLTANVDGSGRFVFTGRKAHFEHKQWSPPTDVVFNDQAWTDLDHSPAGWRDFSRGLDLSRAWIVKREGRDVIALEPTARGFDLYVDDSPNGAAPYAVTIAVPIINKSGE